MSIKTIYEIEVAHNRPRKDRWNWVEQTIWTEKMLIALDNGVKGNKWISLIDKTFFKQTTNKFFAELVRFSLAAAQAIYRFIRRISPDEEIANWRAVCGRTARTVRREGRVKPSLPLSLILFKFY